MNLSFNLYLWIDVDANGSTSDCAVFNNSELLEALKGDTLGLPLAEPLPGGDRPIPYFPIGDDAFTLKTWMRKPYSACNLSNEEKDIQL